MVTRYVATVPAFGVADGEEGRRPPKRQNARRAERLGLPRVGAALRGYRTRNSCVQRPRRLTAAIRRDLANPKIFSSSASSGVLAFWRPTQGTALRREQRGLRGAL